MNPQGARMLDSSSFRKAVRHWMVFEYLLLLFLYGLAFVLTLRAVLVPGTIPLTDHELSFGAAMGMVGFILATTMGIHMLSRRLAFPWLRRLAWRGPLEHLRVNVIIDSCSRSTKVHIWVHPVPGLIALIRDGLILCDASTGHGHIRLRRGDIRLVEVVGSTAKSTLALHYSHPCMDGHGLATVPFDSDALASAWGQEISALSFNGKRTGAQ